MKIEGLKFKFPFRKYQRLILSVIEEDIKKDNKFHIVAPPGAGKTIVGIELMSRFGHPAVVFTPNTTIQLQWKEKVKMFLPDGTDLDNYVSLDPEIIRPINVYTYQLLSTPGENLDFIEKIALDEWKNTIIRAGLCKNDADANKRVKTLRKNNPKAYSSDLSKYYKKVKTEFLKQEEFDGTKFLHKNARDLITRLVDSGVKTIVMDECHHLLDYWAMIIKELIRRVESPLIIGLTATLPNADDKDGVNNYLSILGDVDFEIPTPAVVKEGNLAPYVDLAYFCSPTDFEEKYLKDIQDTFYTVIKEVTEKPTFLDYIFTQIVDRKDGDGKTIEWNEYLNENLYFSIAAIKFLNSKEEYLPKDILSIPEMDEPMSIDDWLTLLERYALYYLKISENKEDHKELSRLKQTIKSFGFVLTETGIRQQRSAGDLILSFSTAKDLATVHILSEEMKAMKENLRAIVICDYEKTSAIVKRRLKGVLDTDAGSAARVFRHIVADKNTTELDAMLVTGSSVLCDADKSDLILSEAQAWFKERKLKTKLKLKKTPYKGILEMVGEGNGWRSRNYVRMVTGLFEKGTTKCLVGTRGIFGEGWDSLSLNTLVDMTSVTTSVSVNQIRGRSIRLHPGEPRKIAHNWDVICISQKFEKGDKDLNRFIRKHRQFYGLGPQRQIMKGLGHVDPMLAMHLDMSGFKKVHFDFFTNRMLKKVYEREKHYDEWGIGEEYQNFEYHATQIKAEDVKFKTVFTLNESLKHIFHNILYALISVGIVFQYVMSSLDAGVDGGPFMFMVGVIVAVLAFVAFCGKNVYKYIKKGFIELPIDSYLLDMGKAVLMALRECELVASGISTDNVRVAENSQKDYDVYLDYGSTKDTDRFSRSFREMLSPIRDQRYLVYRTEAAIKPSFYAPIWYTIRFLFKPFRKESVAYHPVPEILGLNKKRAQTFGYYWKHYVGGGDLIYTRSDEGREFLLKERRKNKIKIRKLAFEKWR